MNPEQQHLLDPSNSQTARGAISRTTARLKSILHRARRTLIAACIAVVLIAVAVAVVKFHIFPTPPPAPGKVLKELEHHRNRWNLPGAAVVAVKDYGETVLIKSGLGVRNSDGDPVTTKSLFHIGSTTKAMQAFAMLRLAERGILDMNSHIKSYRPSFSLNDSAATNLVSLVDLLSHRTGLPTSDLLLFLSNTTIEMFDKRLASWELSYEFRSGYAYQNFMHMLAGLVASDVYYNTTTSGPTANYDNWYNMMKKELFEPLGMKHTTGNIKEWMADDLRSSAAKVDVDPTTGIPNKSKGWLDPLYSIWLYWGAPAGSVTSNVDDLAKYLRFVLKLGQKEDGTRILSESAFRNAFAPHNTYMTSFEKFPPGSEKPYYGLGWIVTSYRGKRMVYHTGGTEMTCMVCLLPDDGFGAFVLTNNVGRWAGPACYHLIDRLVFKDSASETRQFETAEAITVANAKAHKDEVEKAYANRPSPLPLPTVDTKRFHGTYTHNLWGDIIIEQLNPSTQLRPTSFTIDSDSPITLFQSSGRAVHEDALRSASDAPKLLLKFASFPYIDFLKANGLDPLMLDDIAYDVVLVHFEGNKYTLMGDPTVGHIEFVVGAGEWVQGLKLASVFTGSMHHDGSAFRKVA